MKTKSNIQEKVMDKRDVIKEQIDQEKMRIHSLKKENTELNTKVLSTSVF